MGAWHERNFKVDIQKNVLMWSIKLMKYEQEMTLF